MVFRVILLVWEFLLDALAVSRMTDDEKDLEILMLRQQLRIVERKQERGPQIPRWQKVPLVALVLRLKQKASHSRQTLEDSVRLFKPATIINWHREIVRRQWTFKQKERSGRPPIDAELEQWILRVARDNPGLGYDKLKGELRKLGFPVSPTTIRTVLQQHGIPPAPERSRAGSSWRTFLNHYKEQFLACDFLTVESLTLQTLYVLFFIEHATRRVYLAGCTAHPDSDWVSQQTRHLTWELEERDVPMRYLIHDHDTKFTGLFDALFEAEGIEIVNLPFEAPNAIAERWVRSVREECLDKLIILNERHLRRVLTEYLVYYNTRRPHQGIDQDSPLGLEPGSTTAPIRYRKVLGGIIRDYYREAA
ncbi:MAG TPA: integrase core domain-containing protein [Oculatellaceae cyanobacterium]